MSVRSFNFVADSEIGHECKLTIASCRFGVKGFIVFIHKKANTE